MPVFNSIHRPTTTPWGKIQQATQILPGIWSVSTASHGGLILSCERFMAMPILLRCNRYGGGRCFEEDCEWALVTAAFFEEFRPQLPRDVNHTDFIARHLSGDPYVAARKWWLEQQNA